ncbi:MAG TPA: GON domain-containing protein [Kofleriaceae bacterium]
MRLLIAIALAACRFDPHGMQSDASIAADAPVAVDTRPIDVVDGDPCANDGCPASCTEVTGLANDSSVTLYLGGSAGQPWTAFCHDDDEYLTVTATANYGQYTASTKSPGSNVQTTYGRLRVDPSTLHVDISDQTFATSVGLLYHDPANNGSDAVTSMPLGVAMDCAGNNSTTGVAHVDLTGTQFVVASTSTWSTGGNSPGHSVTSSEGGRIVAITGGGNCGWNAPTGSPGNPFNKFEPASLLQLAYSPE